MINGAFTTSAPVESSELPVKVIKQWDEPGLCQLFWADGLAVVGGSGNKIIRLENDGRVKSVLDSSWIVRSESIHCKDAVVMGQFYAVQGSARLFLGLIDLRTGEHVEIIPGDKGGFVLNSVLSKSSYWSSDYQLFLGRLPLSADSREKSLALVHRASKEVTEWKPADGEYPSSWVWSDAYDRQGFWVLTTRPGALYQLGADKEEKLKIPALDKAPMTMLSPKLDRAIAFSETFSDGDMARDGFWIDFSKPDEKKPIALSGRSDIKGMSLGWGAWSPDGKQVALLLLDRAKDKSFQLYIGDPAKPLKKALSKGLRFALADWGSVDEANAGLPGAGTVIWDADSKHVYCKMIDERRSRRGEFRYAIVRVNTAASD